MLKPSADASASLMYPKLILALSRDSSYRSKYQPLQLFVYGATKDMFAALSMSAPSPFLPTGTQGCAISLLISPH